jgi:AraC-like DNA-binding protein
MNGLIIVLYTVGCLVIALSLLLAATSSGTVRSTAFLVSIWIGVVLVMLHTGHMSLAAVFGNIAFVLSILAVHTQAKSRKVSPLLQSEDTPHELKDKVSTNVTTTEDAARQLEQAIHLQHIKRIIETYFHSSLPFRKHGYSIGNLALETGIPVHQLSATINQEFGMNFNEFINSYRVNYLTEIIQDSFDLQSYTLEALGKMAGFNSRTTFIAAIKKHTGMTPSLFFSHKKSSKVKPKNSEIELLMKEVA